MVSLLVQARDCRCCWQPPHGRRWENAAAGSVSPLQSVYPCVWCCLLHPRTQLHLPALCRLDHFFNLAPSCPPRQWTHRAATQGSFHDVFTQQAWKQWWNFASLFFAEICLSIHCMALFSSFCSFLLAWLALQSHSLTAWHRFSDKSSAFNKPPKIRWRK